MFDEGMNTGVKDLGYNQAWPDELKDLSRRHYRAACRVRNLENAVVRVDPTAFDDVMDQLENAKEEFRNLGLEFWKKKYAWESLQFAAMLPSSGKEQRR